MTASAFQPSCSRTSLEHTHPLTYAIGDTKAVSLYQNPLDRDEFKALILACADPRHALATAAEAGKDSKLKLLQLSLNDRTPELIARTALLLLMASELDSDTKDDMEFLWAVWYCLDLFPEQAKRLSGFIQRLLQGDFGDRLQIETGAGSYEVRKIWQAWAGAFGDVSFPSASEAQRRRKRWIDEYVDTCKSTGFAYRVKACASFDLVRVVPLTPPPQTLTHELERWYETGSAHPRATTGKNMVANPTLLQPGTWAWQLHYSSSPFSQYYPLEPTDSLSGTAKQLLEMSLGKLSAMVRGFGYCCTRIQVEVKLWVMDPLALCDHGLSESARFDIINTSSLADFVELLNVILMVAPRLESHPAARFLTHPRIWKSSLQSYLDHALGLPIQMYPTLLGVRLLNDLKRGTQPFTLPERLEWAAVPASKHAPHATGDEGCEIMNGLKALAKRCCGPEVAHGALARFIHEHLGLTPLTLALAAVSAASRASGIIDTKKSWSGNASALHSALEMPETLQAEWETWMCWLLADKLPGQPGKPGELVVFRGRLQPSTQHYLYMSGVVGRIAVTLKIILIDQAQMASTFHPGQSTRVAPRQTLNCVGYNTDTCKATFVVHNSQVKDALTTILYCANSGEPLSKHAELSRLTSTAFTARPPPAARVQLTEPWEEAPASEGALALESVTERDDSYLITVSFSSDEPVSSLQKEGAVSVVFSKQLFAKSVKIHHRFGDPIGCTFACPVIEAGHTIEVSRDRRLLLVTVQKGLIWPEDELLLPKLDIDRLLPVGDALLMAHIAAMFDDYEDLSQESVVKTVKATLFRKASGQWPVPEDPTEAAVHMSRQIIFGLFVNASHKESMMYRLDASPWQGHHSKDSITLFVHPPVRQLPGGQPLLQVSYCDNLEVERKPGAQPTCKGHRSDYHTAAFGWRDVHCTLCRLKAAQSTFKSGGHCDTGHPSKTEMDYLRHTLMYNSIRTLPNRQQRKVLGMPESEWRASFLLPSYFQRHDKKIQPQAPTAGSNSTPPVGTPNPQNVSNGGMHGSAGPGAPAILLRIKSEANELFNAGRYEDAESVYQSALETLKKGNADMEDPAVKALERALYLNSAAALLKLAEAAHGVPALKPPEGLSRSQKADLCLAAYFCQCVFTSEPANVKALYRQAQAYAYLGDDKRAAKAIRKAKRSGGPDEAMERLEMVLQDRIKLKS